MFTQAHSVDSAVKGELSSIGKRLAVSGHGKQHKQITGRDSDFLSDAFVLRGWLEKARRPPLAPSLSPPRSQLFPRSPFYDLLVIFTRERGNDRVFFP